MSNSSRSGTAAPRPHLMLLTGHSAPVVAAAFSSDGRLLATGSYDGTVILWDAASGAMLRRLSGHELGGVFIAFSSDGQILASADYRGAIRLWRVSTGARLRTVRGFSGPLFATSDPNLLIAVGDEAMTWLDIRTGRPVRTVAVERSSGFWGNAAVSLDEATVATVAYDTCQRLQIRDLCTGELKRVRRVPEMLWRRERDPLTGQLRRTHGAQAEVQLLALSPDGRALAVGGYLTLWLCDTRTGRRKHLLICDGDGAHSLAFSADGKLLASGTGSGSVKLWNMASGKLARSLEGHTSRASAVAFSPDGQILASGSHDNTVRLWKVGTGECMRKLPALEFGALSATYSPDGKMIASGHNESSLRVWDAATGELVRTMTCRCPWVSQVRFSEAGAALTALSYPPGWSRSSGATETWAWPGGELEQSSVLHARERRPVPSTSPDGRLLATANQKGKIALRDARSGDLVRELDSPEAPDEIVSLVFAPDSKTLAAGHLWFSVSLWDIESGRFLWLASTHADSISSHAFSPDGSTLAVGGDYDATVVFWDLQTRRRKTTLKGHTNNIRSVSFSPDGAKVITASADGTVRLWEANTGRLLATFMVLPPDSEEIAAEWITFTPEGFYRASPGAARFIRWSKGAAIYDAEQYEGMFYRPEKLEEALR